MRQLVYTMFISHNDASFHLWWKENLVNIEKSQNIMTKIVDKLSRITKLEKFRQMNFRGLLCSTVLRDKFSREKQKTAKFAKNSLIKMAFNAFLWSLNFVKLLFSKHWCSLQYSWQTRIQFWLWRFDINLGVLKWFWEIYSWSVKGINNLKQNDQKKKKIQEKSLTTFFISR